MEKNARGGEPRGRRTARTTDGGGKPPLKEKRRGWRGSLAKEGAKGNSDL